MNSCTLLQNLGYKFIYIWMFFYVGSAVPDALPPDAFINESKKPQINEPSTTQK